MNLRPEVPGLHSLPFRNMLVGTCFTTRVHALNDQYHIKKQVPFDFVLELLSPALPVIKPMFGCTGVYVGEKIVLVLRNRTDEPAANGVWLATTHKHHQSLRVDFPILRSIAVLGPDPTGWQMLPVCEPTFEEAVAKACELILSGDPRIGKVPKSKSIKPAGGVKRSKKENKVALSRTKRGPLSRRDDE